VTAECFAFYKNGGSIGPWARTLSLQQQIAASKVHFRFNASLAAVASAKEATV
jgi:hypothetical protein